MAKQFREPLCTTKMGDRGLEPLTSFVSSRRSSQLSDLSKCHDST